MSDDQHTTPVEFRTIDRFPGYRFGADGSVWTQWQQAAPKLGGAWKLKSQRLSQEGYFKASLACGNTCREYKVHRLIAEAFHGHCPSGMECRHLDGNPLNNRPENLRWGTHRENSLDKIIHGDQPCGSRHYRARLDEVKVAQIEVMLAQGVNQAEIGRQFGVTSKAISSISSGKTWKHVTAGHRVYPRGVRYGGAKLDSAQVAEIKAMLARGMKQAEIARQFGVGQQQISKIKNGHRWPDVTTDLDVNFGVFS